MFRYVVFPTYCFLDVKIVLHEHDSCCLTCLMMFNSADIHFGFGIYWTIPSMLCMQLKDIRLLQQLSLQRRAVRSGSFGIFGNFTFVPRQRWRKSSTTLQCDPADSWFATGTASNLSGVCYEENIGKPLDVQFKLYPQFNDYFEAPCGNHP